MVDRDDIPQKIDLENTERAPRGEDPLVRFEEDDYSSETKQKIGDYFRQELIDQNNTSTAEISDSPGTTIFRDTPESSDSYLAKQPTEARTNFDQIGRSNQFERDIIPGDKGDLDAESELQASGLLTILRDAPRIVSDEVSRTIDLNALHGPDNLFITPDRPNEGESGAGRHVIQSRLGTHSPQKTFKNVAEDPDLTIKQLKNLGCRILLEASGEIYVPTDFDDVAQLIAARAATTVPGLPRLGFRISANRFGAKEILNGVNKPEVEIDINGPTKPTFGSVNNPLVPFSAIASGQSSVVVGTLLVFTFSGIFTALSKLLNGANEVGSLLDLTQESASAAEKRHQTLGSYYPKNPSSNNTNFGLALLGLQENLLVTTEHEYSACVQKGLEIFFGVNTSNVLGSIGGSATRIVETPGYYNGILRLLVKSISDPLSQFIGNIPGVGGNAGPSFTTGPADYDPIIGPPNDPFALVESVRILKESKLLKFMNVLANLGDIALATSERIAEESTIDSVNDTFGDTIYELDGPQAKLIPNPAALVKKNRLSDRLGPRFDNSLAWGADTLPSLYMINSEIQQAEEDFSQTSQYSSLAGERNFLSTNNNRLSAEYVRRVEDRLDSYYMPFYFHDLRTNEIVAFHAFLENVSDSHTADYNETEGYGRIGKVYTYKNTNRTISLSFKVVPVNIKDFDAMWFKLNKILMMLYPQYTLGRAIEANNQKFIQPFSQLPSSSPMIRLRVGDLIKSNFSEFDLARLFGLGSQQFDVSQVRAQRLTQETLNAVRNKAAEIRQRQSEGNFQEGERFRMGISVSQIASRSTRGTALIERTTDRFRGVAASRVREIENQERQRRSNGILDVQVGHLVQISGRVADQQGVYNVQFVPPLAGEQAGTIYKINFNALGPNGERYSPSNVVRHDDTSVLAAARTYAAREQPSILQNLESIEQTSADIDAFFGAAESGGTTRSPTVSQQQAGGASSAQGTVGGNPIFKAFESTQGKGLAGFIKSLQFNWEGALWETEAENSKAPQWCTVQLEFAPVHDLNPGIDVNGNMIAPIYNIGSILQQMKIRRAGRTESDSAEARNASNLSRTSTNNGSSS